MTSPYFSQFHLKKTLISQIHTLSTQYKHDTIFTSLEPPKCHSQISSNPPKNNYFVKKTNSQLKQHSDISLITIVALMLNHTLQRLKRNKTKVCSSYFFILSIQYVKPSNVPLYLPWIWCHIHNNTTT